MPQASKKSKQVFKKFTGYEGKLESQKKISSPNELICIARAESLCYYSDKINGGGTGLMESFKHRFGSKIYVYTDPKGSFLLLAGPGLKVTKRGIVG